MVLLIVLGVVVAVIALVLAMASQRPDTSHIERQRTLPAPPTAIYPHLIDFACWRAWSPWEGLDPAMTREYSTPSGGVGATYAWRGNKKVGEGRMEILAAEPATRVALRLQFLKPWQATNDTTFVLRPDGDATVVTWSMDGTSSFGMKLFGLFVDLDKLVGKDFARGLDQLAVVVASSASDSR